MDGSAGRKDQQKRFCDDLEPDPATGREWRADVKRQNQELNRYMGKKHRCMGASKYTWFLIVPQLFCFGRRLNFSVSRKVCPYLLPVTKSMALLSHFLIPSSQIFYPSSILYSFTFQGNMQEHREPSVCLIFLFQLTENQQAMQRVTWPNSQLGENCPDFRRRWATGWTCGGTCGRTCGRAVGWGCWRTFAERSAERMVDAGPQVKHHFDIFWFTCHFTSHRLSFKAFFFGSVLSNLRPLIVVSMATGRLEVWKRYCIQFLEPTYLLWRLNHRGNFSSGSFVRLMDRHGQRV